MRDYVIVYVRRIWNSGVLLILKNRPVELAGRLNLPGGKIEPGETPEQAAMRELKEEVGCTSKDPKVIGKIYYQGGTIYCVAVTSCHYQGEISPTEDEPTMWLPVSEALQDPRLIPNLRVIIPMMAFEVPFTVIDMEDSFSVVDHTLKVMIKGGLIADKTGI